MDSFVARTSLMMLGASLLAGCGGTFVGQDHPAVFVRNNLNYFGECSSWVVSHNTGVPYCASPAFEAKVEMPVAPAAEKFDETKTDKDSLMAAGEKVFGNVCAACHQKDGKGLPGQFPPLAGSGAFYGDARKMAGFVVKGLSGEIEVQGQKYNAAMPSQGHLSDYELAAALTYARNSWGNADGIVLPDDVKAVR